MCSRVASASAKELPPWISSRTWLMRVATAENGEIVVALIDGEATLKRFFHEGDRIRLQPENGSLELV